VALTIRSWHPGRIRRRALMAYGFILPSLALIGGVMAYPMFYSFYLSFHFRILSRPRLGTPFVGLANYLEAFRDPLFLRALWQTVYFSVVSILAECVIGLGVALLLNQRFRGRNVTRGLVLLPWMLSPVVAAFTWAWLLNDAYGLVNFLLMKLGVLHGPVLWLGDVGWAMGTIIVVDVWREVPFVAVVLLAGLQSIPDELYEAARIDGATPGQSFVAVTLPLLKPSFMVALLMRTMIAIRLFELVFIMTKGGPASTTEMLATFTYKEAFIKFNMGYSAATSVIMLLLSLGISLVYIRTMGGETALR
jgi:multiple sugar transport system permease protein